MAGDRLNVSPTDMALTPPAFFEKASNYASVSQRGARPSMIDFIKITILSLTPDANANDMIGT